MTGQKVTDFKSRFSDLCDHSEFNDTEIGSALSVSKQTVSAWRAGTRSPRFPMIQMIADYFGVNVGWLLGYDVDPSQPDLPDLPDIIPLQTRRIPLLGDIACGAPTEPVQEFEAYVTAGSDVRADFALRAHGDSMIGARIMDGDIVFIRRQPVVDDGQIAAVLIDGETTLKRVRHVGGQLLLLPENPAFSPIIAEKSQDIRILGRAIAFQSDVR